MNEDNAEERNLAWQFEFGITEAKRAFDASYVMRASEVGDDEAERIAASIGVLRRSFYASLFPDLPGLKRFDSALQDLQDAIGEKAALCSVAEELRNALLALLALRNLSMGREMYEAAEDDVMRQATAMKVAYTSFTELASDTRGEVGRLVCEVIGATRRSFAKASDRRAALHEVATDIHIIRRKAMYH